MAFPSKENTDIAMQPLVSNHHHAFHDHGLLKRTHKLAHWTIDRRSPIFMVFFLLLGLGIAIGHHVYYLKLDETAVMSASQQQWTLRVGFLLAFLSKTSFAASIAIAFTQYLWTVLRSKPLKLETIDAMFSMTHTPLSFFKVEVFSKGTLLALLALTSWFMPLLAIFTPAAISVYDKTLVDFRNEPVPTVDLARTNGTLWTDSTGVGWPVNASPAVSRLLTAVASSMQIVSLVPPAVNSTYRLQFPGPALRCNPLDQAQAVTHDFSLDQQYNNSLAALWEGESGYNGTSSYNNLWESVTPGLQDVKTNLIFVRTGTYMRGGEVKNVSCQLWNASYDVQFTFINGIQNTEIRNLAYGSVFNTSLWRIPIYSLPAGTRQFMSMYLALSTLLTGRVAVPNGLSSSGLPGGDLPVVNTGLFACPEVSKAIQSFSPSNMDLGSMFMPWMCRAGSVPSALEDLSHNFTISLLSSNLLSANVTTPVSITTHKNYWRYDKEELLAAYGVAVGVTLLSLIIGLYALKRNGYSASRSFSTILFTTRNADLDSLGRGQCLGNYPLQEDVGQTRLRFGVMDRIGDGVGHATFGADHTVRTLKKGEPCA